MTALQWIGLGIIGAFALVYVVVWVIIQILWQQSERAARR